MLKARLPGERLALIGLACLLVAAIAYAVVRGSSRPAPIVFQGLPATAAQVEGQGNASRGSGQSPAGASPGSDAMVVVHAAGAVRRPGVLRLPPGARVEDAIKAAGGSIEDADLDAVNLAARLVDGTQLFVPKKGATATDETVADTYRGGATAGAYSSRGSAGQSGDGSSRHAPGWSKKVPPAQPINLNSATSEQLQRVPGIGPATAQKILDYRKEHGKFASIDELMAIQGIGQKKLDAMRKYLRV